MGDRRARASAEDESIPNSVDSNSSERSIYEVEFEIRVSGRADKVRVTEQWTAEDATEAVNRVRDYYSGQHVVVAELWEVPA